MHYSPLFCSHQRCVDHFGLCAAQLDTQIRPPSSRPGFLSALNRLQVRRRAGNIALVAARPRARPSAATRSRSSQSRALTLRREMRVDEIDQRRSAFVREPADIRRLSLEQLQSSPAYF